MEILSNQFIEALGWTLAHTLWQASLIAILLAIALVLFNQRSAKFRYNLGAGALAFILILSLGTFVYEYASLEMSPNSESVYTNYSMPQTDTKALALSEHEASPFFSITAYRNYFDEHLPLIVTCWLLGVLIFSLRLIGSVAFLQRLKNYRNYPANTVWQLKLNELTELMQITQKVKLLESAIINSPVVIGYFKPVILVPIGMLSGLPTEQVEAILAHELAHIQRKDYLVNIVQNIIETLFFFHPAIWWISSLVRHERECCCDDLAVQTTQNSVSLVKALTELESFRTHRSQANLALALKGRSGQLYQRISRIVSNKPHIPAFKEGLFLVSIVVASLFFSSLQANDVDDSATQLMLNETALKLTAQDNMFFQDTTKKVPIVFKDGASNYAFTEEGKVYHVVMNDKNKVIDLYVDGKQVAKSEYNKHNKAVKKALVLNMPPPPDAPKPVAAIEEIVEVPAPRGNSTNITIRNGQRTFNTTNKNGEYVFAKLDKEDNITELFIEGKKATEAQKKEYQTIIKKEIASLKEKEKELRVHEKELREQEKEILEKAIAMEEELREQEQIIHEERLKAEMARLQALELQEVAEVAEVRAKLSERRAKKEKVEAQRAFVKAQIAQLKEEEAKLSGVKKEEAKQRLEVLSNKQNELARLQKELSREQVHMSEQEEETRRLRELQLKELALHKEELEKQQRDLSLLSQDMKNREKLLKEINKMLLQDGLIDNENGYNLELDENSLLINGKKKPEKYHKKYLKIIEKFDKKKLKGKEKFIIKND